MATRTWSSAASTDMNLATNYSGAGALLSTDDLVFNNTSVINSTASAALSVASITVAANYTGTFTVSGRTITTTGDMAFNSTTIALVINTTTVMNIGGNFTIGKTPSANQGTWNFTGTPTITALAAVASLGSWIFSNGATLSGAYQMSPLRMKCAPNNTYTFVAGQTLVVSTYTAGDWSGTAGNLVTFVSSIPETAYLINPAVDVTASYMSITDCTNGSITKMIGVSDGTSVRGLYCVNIKWPVDIIYQDYGMADDTGNGMSMSTAKKTAQAARNMLSNAGDIIICRRATTEIPAATLTYPSLSNGTPSSPIKIMGMPRGTLAFTGTWVNNLNAIYALNITAKPEQHIGRWVKNNSDGADYLITDIIEQVAYTGRTNGGFAVGDAIVGATSTASWVVLQDTDLGSNTGLLVVWKWATALGRLLYSNDENLQKAGQTRGVANGAGVLCFCIDRPYPGSSAAGAAGTIEADEDYAWSQTLTSGNGADLLSTWTADAHDLPIINFNGTAFYDNITRVNYEVRNLYYRNSAQSDTSCPLTNSNVGILKVLGCLFTTNVASKCCCGAYSTYFNRCIFHGFIASARGILSSTYYFVVLNSAIHHVSTGSSGSSYYAYNVNLGVEKESTSSEISNSTPSTSFYYKDVAIGSSSILLLPRVGSNLGSFPLSVYFENFNKVLNAHKFYISDVGTVTKNDCTGEPVQRTGGGTSVAEFLLNTGTYSAQTKAPTGMSSVGFCPAYIEMKVWLSSSQLTNANFKFYVQSVTDALTSANFWLECEYIDVSTAQGYHKKIITSTESVTARSDASDWTQFISTGNFTPAAAGWVTLRIFDNLYSTSKKYVDPMYNGALRYPLWSMGQASPALENVASGGTNMSAIFM